LSGDRVEAAALRAIIALFVLLHTAWLVRVPDDLDSFNFVLGVRLFDVVQHRPHPPGAPVFMVIGKAARWLWNGFGLPADSLVGSTPAALAAVSLVAGTLCIVLVWQIVRGLDQSSSRGERAAILTASTPLLWIQAARPLSDVLGACLVLIVYLLLQRGWRYAAWIAAGIAIGLRVQTALLTIPVLMVSLVAHRDTGSEATPWQNVADTARPRPRGAGWTAVTTGAALMVGIAAWFVPLLASTGPHRYWTALVTQAGDDFTSPIMLAATPTIRNGAEALFNTFITPWGPASLAAGMLIAALVGGLQLRCTSGRGASRWLICAAPYLLFHLAFHETSTVRYALPVVIGLVPLAAVGVETLPSRWTAVAFALLVTANLFVSVQTLQAFHHRSSPGIALFKAMYRRVPLVHPAFVTGHQTVRLRRLQEVLMPALPWQTVSRPAPYEWESLIDHWRQGGTAPVWFIADPRRTDLTLMDQRAQTVLETFGLDPRAMWALRGLRPRALVWRELRVPAWIAVKGFALTPEVGGLAARDRQGPAFDGAVALVRRFQTGAVMIVGGRHVGQLDDPPVRVTIAIDGRVVSSVTATPRERAYVMHLHLGPSQLRGEGPYATVTVRSQSVSGDANVVPVTVEQFDYQPIDGMLFAWASGWHEPEQAQTGVTWRWASRHATLVVHHSCRAEMELTMRGDLAPLKRAMLPQQILVSHAGRVLDRIVTRSSFSRRIIISGATAPDTCDEAIAFDSMAWMVPADDHWHGDRRELAFRLVELDLEPRVR
jgi:hypothetical protein